MLDFLLGGIETSDCLGPSELDIVLLSAKKQQHTKSIIKIRSRFGKTKLEEGRLVQLYCLQFAPS